VKGKKAEGQSGIEPPQFIGCLMGVEELAELRDGKGGGSVVLEAVDGRGFEHGVDDGFFAGVYGGFEERRELFFAEQRKWSRARCGLTDAIRGGKSDGVVAAAVAAG